jgi:hypothetical protein
MRISFALLAIGLAGCARAVTIPPLALPFPTDTVTDRVIADGVIKRYIRSPKGPWGIHVLDVDLSRCYSAVAVKGASGAAGRKKTSAMLEELRATHEVIGGVNADFFSLTGFQGIPSGAFISDGKVVVGPGNQAVLSIDSAGKPSINVFESRVRLYVPDLDLTAVWNRPAPNGVAVYDRSWGTKLDTASGVIELTVEGKPQGLVTRRDTTVQGAEIPENGYVVVVGRNAPQNSRNILGLMSGFGVQTRILPFHPREAVGGRPALVADSAILPAVDTIGQVSFRNRNPRTAIGIANNGRRLMLVVVDGRQTPYSDGMTVRETAELMLALGARDAINLDGGGSSALVFMEPDQKKLVVANRPSDATGERAVGNALAIVQGCSR